jgi:hypothetical protein
VGLGVGLRGGAVRLNANFDVFSSLDGFGSVDGGYWGK